MAFSLLKEDFSKVLQILNSHDLEDTMSINFCPSREQMTREVELCVIANRLDVLTSICACCVYAIFDDGMLVSQCLQCAVRQGMARITDRDAREDLLISSCRVCADEILND